MAGNVAEEWFVWRCKRCGFNNGPNSYCRGCGFARNPWPQRRNALLMLVCGLVAGGFGFSMVTHVDQSPGKRFPMSQVASGSVLIAVAIGALIAAIRLWSVANRIVRTRKSKRMEP